MDKVRSLRIRFEPSGRIVHVLPGTNLLTASERAGFRLSAVCGGRGSCGKCKIRILQGAPSFTSLEKESLSSEERRQGIHLACQTLVHQDLTIEILTEEQTEGTRFLTYGMPVEMELDDHIQKFYLELPRPDLENQTADLETIEQAISPKGEKLKISLPLLQKLSTLLRDQHFKITVVTTNGQLLALEKGDTTSRRFGLAVDLGTTTVVGVLVDMSTGKDVAISARTNPQSAHGADVISRIQFATREPDGLQRLQRLVIGSINEIIDDLTQQAGVAHREIYEMTLAGNTIMEHLFLGVNPEYIALAPYVPTFKRSQIVPATELGLNILPQATVWTVPNISGYVGGDITGLILAFELHRRDKLTLALDIGTNGEIVLGSRERLLCCSAAAGPAFEGGHISCGMRAMTGAIESVSFNGSNLSYRVIGGVAPQGICGTGLIDITSEMLKHGIIDPGGRIVYPDGLDLLKQRIIPAESHNNFLIASAGETAHHQPIVITQKDIRELQLAKGAIAAGMAILMAELGITKEDIDEVLIAGAFGNYINKYNAQSLGLIPPVPPERVNFVGNAASVGAKKFLLSQAAKDEAHQIIEITQYIELSGRVDFQEKFANAMFWGPETELNSDKMPLPIL